MLNTISHKEDALSYKYDLKDKMTTASNMNVRGEAKYKNKN